MAVSLVLKLMIAGWVATLAMIAVCALNESGKLFNLRKRIAWWVQPFDPTSVGTGKSKHQGTVGIGNV